jgi:cytochrome c5
MKNPTAYIAAAIVLILSGCYYDTLNEIHREINNDVSSDNTPATYANAVDLILRTSCTSCHNGKLQSGNVNLEGYDNVKLVATNGKLLGSIEHKSGFQAMPPGTTIRACEIQKVQQWVANQMPQ